MADRAKKNVQATDYGNANAGNLEQQLNFVGGIKKNNIDVPNNTEAEAIAKAQAIKQALIFGG